MKYGLVSVQGTLPPEVGEGDFAGLIKYWYTIHC